MRAKTYRVTWWVGGWRSVPWPFGFVDVADIGLSLRSWHWSWWVKDRKVSRGSIRVIRVVRRFGTGTLVIEMQDGPTVKFRPVGADAELLVRDLEQYGYVVDDLTT